MKLIFKISLVFSFLGTVSCSYLQKKRDELQGRNNIVGIGSQDIQNKDIDEDRKGSDSGEISGLQTIFFELDSSRLSPSVQKVLKSNKEWLESHSSVVRFELEGHCDSVGSEAYNIGLGQRRADSVKSFLKSLGVSEDKLNVISYGEEKLLSPSDNNLNRRVNFVPVY